VTLAVGVFVRRRLTALGALVAWSCGGQTEPVVAKAPSAAVGEPPPHYHEYPEIPPDELGEPPSPVAKPPREAASDLPDDCPMSEVPPPFAAPRRIRSGPPVTNYIPPAVIMTPIRARAPCFRGCYDAGLARSSEREGKILLRFVIDEDGWVRTVRVVEETLGDSGVVDCVRRAFVGLKYPVPEGGRVTVVYPLRFSPSGG
jgi:hypothetical protein